jgi:hypothetical protein
MERVQVAFHTQERLRAQQVKSGWDWTYPRLEDASDATNRGSRIARREELKSLLELDRNVHRRFKHLPHRLDEPFGFSKGRACAVCSIN